jgi:Rod binding domain-containing protein
MIEGAAETGLPAVNQATEPAWVRHGSASTQKAYDTALAFEGMLVEQLSKSMAQTSGLGGEESSGEGESSEDGSAASGELSSMLPQALSSGVMSAGGLGLAAQMTQQLQVSQAVSSAEAKGTGASVQSTGGSGS